MTHRVVIVDDEKPARDRLRRLIGDHTDFVVVGEADDVPSAVALIDRERARGIPANRISAVRRLIDPTSMA